MTGLIRHCGVVGTIAFVAAVSAPPGSAAPTRSASWMGEELRAGRRIVLQGATVTDALDLGNVDSVRGVFKCHDCTFRGPVRAADVIFERTVDLSGSTFAGPVDFTGSTFRAPALFRAPPSQVAAPGKRTPCRFRQDATFSLAVFEDLASFGGSKFCRAAEFRDTRFSDATFIRTWFDETADFARASFRSEALFNDSHFEQPGSFEEVDFHGRADFARAKFLDGAVLADARFAQGGSFLVTKFQVKGADEAATFQGAVSGGDLDLTYAKFEGEIATFSDFVSAGTVTFRDVTFDEVHGVAMSRIQVRHLILDADSAAHVSEKAERLRVLGLIEASAKERGDLVTANDAHYALRALRSRSYPRLWRAVDYVFYRGIAGYFVRPLRPLVVLGALVTLVALLRMRRRQAGAAPDSAGSSSRRARVWARTRTRCGSFFTCLLDTFAIAGPRWRGGGEAPSALPQRLEVLAYRLLLVCALIGLANSNPTLRQMVDTLL